MADNDPGAPVASVVLWWIPVGADGHVVRHTSRWWELAQAALARRPPLPLFHAALEIFADGGRYVVEMTPAWGGPREADRGVVRTGPVGLRCLGRSRLFRYEIRCWRDGVIPDRHWAVGGPIAVTRDRSTADRLLRRVGQVPALTWGREALSTGDMWNSNSLVSWLLADADVDAEKLGPPVGGRAPGWAAGLAVARRSAPARNPGR